MRAGTNGQTGSAPSHFLSGAIFIPMYSICMNRVFKGQTNLVRGYGEAKDTADKLDTVLTSYNARDRIASLVASKG